MQRFTLKLVDPADHHDDDVWIESCAQCGTLDNHGHQLCSECDDLAA